MPTGKGKGKASFSKEYVADTPEALIEACRDEDEEIGYEIGTPEKIRELCESAPIWLARARRGRRR
ncbi:MAG: hypothetical protein U0990_09975 [Candidatus Nanopelagicales bacterium]|nr:hypothetical protein [Candidatus Nanopelagicales bacterium]